MLAVGSKAAQVLEQSYDVLVNKKKRLLFFTRQKFISYKTLELPTVFVPD